MAKFSNRQVSTIWGAIEYGVSQEVRTGDYRTKALIQDSQSGEIIQIPYLSLINKYRDFLSEIVTDRFPLSDADYRKYKYSPTRLSFDLYGTTSYAYALMELNNCPSIIDFNKKWLRVYDPKKLPDYINEIYIKEGLI